VKCKHQGKRLDRRWVPVEPGLLPKAITAETDICADCGEWLSLGPSDETEPSVAVEIRAVEIVASFHESDWPFTSWRTTQDENLGWRHDDSCVHTHGYDAGRLARAIIDHPSPTAEEGEGE
jgi:hypothetical protein